MRIFEEVDHDDQCDYCLSFKQCKFYYAPGFKSRKCDDCINMCYTKQKSLDYIFMYFYLTFIEVLNMHTLTIDKKIQFRIGENKKNFCTKHVEVVSLALFNTTCERARSGIRTFCLYCIRYQKGRVNRDLRRKISELLWIDKIQWLEEWKGLDLN